MLFNSLAYAIFFPLVVGIYFALPGKVRWAWLVAASAAFYCWLIPVYFLILAAVIVVDYFAAFGIDQSAGKRRKCWLIVSLAANIGILAVFKYYDFLAANLHHGLSAIGVSVPLYKFGWELPIGLSFHTFQAMSYTIEVYRGTQKPERHFGVYSLYVLYFPQLVAGPIERPQNILHQFHVIQKFNYSKAVSGFRLIGLGLIKKVCIADRLAELVDPIYGDPAAYSGPLVLVASAAFAIQIYCDFSGYSDIAIGSARVMGHDLMTNFRRPYLATNIQEFWRRWHISLSAWFRDYLYIPLGGNRVAFWKQCRNVLFVFALSGLWHGANWAYIIWGALHGLLIVGYMLYRKRVPIANDNSRWRSVSAALLTFGLVTLTWVFFRAGTLEKSVAVFQSMGANWIDIANPALLKQQLAAGGTRGDLLPVLIVLVLVWYMIDRLLEKRDLDTILESFRPFNRFAVYATALAMLLLIGSDGTDSFIYFQF